jgi:hypothetical protein
MNAACFMCVTFVNIERVAVLRQRNTAMNWVTAKDYQSSISFLNEPRAKVRKWRFADFDRSLKTGFQASDFNH